MSQLTAGLATVDITPPLGLCMAGYGSRDQLSQSVVDPLFAQALVFDDGHTRCAVVCCDLIALRAAIVAEVRRRAAERSGISADHIMLCCSHTHWGPAVSGAKYLPPKVQAGISPEYREQLINQLADLVVQADGQRVATVAGWNSGWANDISFNRRQVGPDFKTEMHLVLEPPLAAIASAEGNELALAWEKGEHRGPRLTVPLEQLGGVRVGPADAEVPVLRLDHADGRPLASLVSFACHAVCGGGDFYGYSADYVGFARGAFEAITGSPMLFADGCAGDQVPRWRQNDARLRVGKSLGSEAARVWLAVDERRGDLPLAVTSRQVKLPLNPAILPVEEARAALEAHPEKETTKAVWEREMLALAEETEGMADGYPAEVWALRLGDFALVGLPGEVLTEIGMQIKQRSPFDCTMTVSLANDSIGYLPTDDACREGGYEPSWSPVGPGTERVLVETGLALLEELAGE